MVLLALLLVLCLWLRRRRRRRNHTPPGVTGDSSFGDNFNEDGEWQIVVPRSSGPSGGSVPSGEGQHHSSVQGSGNSRHGVAEAGVALLDPAPGHENPDPEAAPWLSSGRFVAIANLPDARDRPDQPSWTPWRRNSVQAYQDVPASDDLAADVNGASPPMSPRSAQYSDGHNSDAEQETLLHPAAISLAAVAAQAGGSETRAAESTSNLTRNRIVERAREAVAQREARQRASYVPGAAGFFNWFRSSWASSWRGPRTPGPSTDELGFRPRSEKSNPGSRASTGRRASRISRASRVPATSQRSHQSSEKSEKSVLSPHDTDDSPPTPHSSQFPSPPPTHLEAHALVRSRSRTSTFDRQFLTISAYSAGGGSMTSGNTVYYDAIDVPPLPSPLSPYLAHNRSETSLRLVPRSTSAHQPSPTTPLPDLAEFGELSSLSSGSELLPPPPLRDQAPSPYLSLRPPGSARSQQSSLRSLAYRAGDVLDDPPPLPSASLEQRQHQPIPASPPPSYNEWRHVPPPGLEQYSPTRMPAFGRDSYLSEHTGAVDVLEDEPPSAGSQWRQIASGNADLPLGDRSIPPVRLTPHFRHRTLESVRPQHS